MDLGLIATFMNLANFSSITLQGQTTSAFNRTSDRVVVNVYSASLVLHTRQSKIHRAIMIPLLFSFPMRLRQGASPSDVTVLNEALFLRGSGSCESWEKG